jgi:hypothetical protein
MTMKVLAYPTCLDRWAFKSLHFLLLVQFRPDTLVTAEAQGTPGCDG